MQLLPLPDIAVQLSPAVYVAYDQLAHVFHTASAYIESDNVERHRLEQYIHDITDTACSTLLLLQETSQDEHVPMSWLDDIADQFSGLLELVNEKYTEAVDNDHGTRVIVPEPVQKVRRKRRGAPAKIINPHVLREAFQSGRHISQAKLAKVLCVDRKTLRREMRGLDIQTGFAEITDEELDDLVRQYLLENPIAGRSYVIGNLRAHHGLRVQRQQVISSMERVSKLARGIRKQAVEKKKHRPYHVPRPNHLWHIDGHHKLISWGIVIHGAVDGFSRKATGLQADTNNAALTVLKMFLRAIKKHGIPLRVRGDRGGENRDVSILMILLRGSNHCSFMWGSSVFNTRIERLWVEVGRRFARNWRAFFLRLQRCHLLKRKNSNHRWLLHYLFLDDINRDCDKFCDEWNAHPISGLPSGKSPNDLEFLGKLKCGTYDYDECQGLKEEEINAFYGFDEDGEPFLDEDLEEMASIDSDDQEDGFDMEEGSDINGDDDEGIIGSDVEDDYDSDSELLHEIEGAIQDGLLEDGTDIDTKMIDSNIRHDPVPVPPANCPFNSAQFELFEHGLNMITASGELPSGYGVGSGAFDEHEEITSGLGCRGRRIQLSRQIWQPRVELWAQALYAMNTILS